MDYRGLRALTAKELAAALTRDGRRVTVAPHGDGSTFAVKTLQSIIERQARWNEDDLKRLRLIG